MFTVKLAAAIFLALMPSPIKILVLRYLYGYSIGRGVRIGIGTIFYGVKNCRIADHVNIGRLNAFHRIADLEILAESRIGYLNLFRGGRRISIGRYATILRCNVMNAIIDPDTVNEFAAEEEHCFHMPDGDSLLSTLQSEPSKWWYWTDRKKDH